MRKTTTVILTGMVALSLIVAPAAEAKKKKPKGPQRTERTAESSYDTPAIGHPDVAVGCSGANGCAEFALGADESYITLSIEDSSGMPVYASAGQDTDGDGLADASQFNFCGSTPEPVPVLPGYPLNIFIGIGPGASPPCAPALGTSGTVTAVISNMP